MAFYAPRRLLRKLKRVLLSDLPNCVCPLEFLGQYRVNFVCRYSIRAVSGYALPKRVIVWTIANIVVWNGELKWGADNDECQKAFDTVKAYLIQPPVLVPPSSDRPLILYLIVRLQSIGCILGQKDDSTHAKREIYYLSKKFTKGESNYPEIEKICCTLVWVMQRFQQYTLYHTIRLLSKTDPPKYLLGSPSSMRNIAKMALSIDGEAVDLKVKELEVFGDSMLTIFQTLRQWKTKDPKLVPYHEYLEELMENFEKVLFMYTPRMKNQFADALATLASMVSITKENLIVPLEFEISQGPAHCDVIDVVDGKPCGESLYRRSFDATLLQCVDENEAQRLMKEVHKGNCGPHMNGLMLAKKLMRLGYFWSTMKTDCIKH
ncbi:hypothetical protein CRG98_029076, partial [Punica granatum]